MQNSFLRTVIFLFIFVIAAVLVDRYFFDRKTYTVGASVVKKPSSFLFAKLENGGFFFRKIIGIKNTISENDSLKKENFFLLSQLADYDDLKNENEFLRKSLDISLRFNKKVTYANIYQFQMGLDGYDVLVNKGADGGLNEGDTVITEEGVLIGRVEKVEEHFSRVLVVNDTDFSVTAKVLNSETAGIARGAFTQGLYFDLIVQNDLIKEGDVVVSSGMDLVPPALVLGTVSYVESNDTDLFKKVKIRPAMGEVKMGRVLIIRKGDGN